MWVDWFNDEIALFTAAANITQQDDSSGASPKLHLSFNEIVELFKVAVEEFPSMPLVWAMYCNFYASHGTQNNNSNIATIRQVFEQAIASALSRNMKWSHEIWDEYRDFEQNLPLDDELVTQTLRSLFKRQFETAPYTRMYIQARSVLTNSFVIIYFRNI